MDSDGYLAIENRGCINTAKHFLQLDCEYRWRPCVINRVTGTGRHLQALRCECIQLLILLPAQQRRKNGF